MDGGRSFNRGGGGGFVGGHRNNNYSRDGGGRGRGGRGRGHNSRHQPYNNTRRGGHRGGGGGGRGNRFGDNQGQQLDAQTVMVRQVSSFVSRVGELKNINEDAFPTESAPGGLRPVEVTTAGNIMDLVAVLCLEDKMEILFKYLQDDDTPATFDRQANSVLKPQDRIGRLGHLIVSCAGTLPLQTPCYAALTLAVHEQIKGSRWEGFAPRCAEYAMSSIARDLDAILSGSKDDTVAYAACRIKLILRYLATLGKIGIVHTYQNEQAADPTKLTVFGLLSIIVDAAKAAAVGAARLPSNAASPAAAHLLIYVVLSTLPFVNDYVSQDSVDEWILKPIEALLQSYRSTFVPGTGETAILLKGEQDDGDHDGEEEEEDDDDDDDESAPICDSLQDLLRVAKRFREPTRFALPSDKPWTGLTRRSTPNPESGETETYPVEFSDEPIYLSIQGCRSLSFLFDGVGDFELVSFSLEGVIFGRLPIFGSPPDPDDEDDDEEEMEGGVGRNEQLEAFKTRFTLLDRYFVSDTIRDCLICYDPYVNPTGMQQGSAKSVAEELLNACHMITGDSPSKGMEYAIVESLFGLIAQSSEESTLKHVYLSRVLLELTRLHPQLFSPAIAVAMTNLFGDYLPALVPTARDNYSRWFAFHLINTDYQWPNAYWQLWEPYAVSPNMSSRGEFVQRAIQVMVENLSNPSLLLTDCLNAATSLANEFFPRRLIPLIEREEGDLRENLEMEIGRRVWQLTEDPTMLRDFLLGEEVSNSLGVFAGSWSKTEALVRALVGPVKKILESLKEGMENSEEDENRMVEDNGLSKDFHSAVIESLSRYSKTIHDVLQNEAETCGDVSEGGVVVLQQVEDAAYFNSSILQDIVSCLLRHSVVGGMSVFRWALRDGGESTDAVSRWWIFGLIALDQSTNSVAGTGGMMIDGNEAEILAGIARTELLRYAARRVCSLVATRNEKRLNSMSVHLIEGLKTVVVKSKLMDKNASLEGKSVGSLSDCCAGFGGSSAVDLLKKILSNL
jgi:hypothetical protein